MWLHHEHAGHVPVDSHNEASNTRTPRGRLAVGWKAPDHNQKVLHWAQPRPGAHQRRSDDETNTLPGTKPGENEGWCTTSALMLRMWKECCWSSTCPRSRAHQQRCEPELIPKTSTAVRAQTLRTRRARASGSAALCLYLPVFCWWLNVRETDQICSHTTDQDKLIRTHTGRENHETPRCATDHEQRVLPSSSFIPSFLPPSFFKLSFFGHL